MKAVKYETELYIKALEKLNFIDTIDAGKEKQDMYEMEMVMKALENFDIGAYNV